MNICEQCGEYTRARKTCHQCGRMVCLDCHVTTAYFCSHGNPPTTIKMEDVNEKEIVGKW